MTQKYSLLVIVYAVFSLSGMQENNRPEQYYQSLKNTQRYNDTIKNMFIKKALFKQLFVQAYNDQRLDKNSFSELFEKVNKGIITQAEDPEYLVMTSKDIWHRLLSYIPYIVQKGLFVNGKEIKLECYGYQTEEDKVETQKERASIEQEEARAREQGKEFRQSCRMRIFSGDKIVCKYSFEKEDPEHHEMIAQEFKNITNIEW